MAWSIDQLGQSLQDLAVTLTPAFCSLGKPFGRPKIPPERAQAIRPGERGQHSEDREAARRRDHHRARNPSLSGISSNSQSGVETGNAEGVRMLSIRSSSGGPLPSSASDMYVAVRCQPALSATRKNSIYCPPVVLPVTE